MKVGDKIVWGDLDGRNLELREGTITKVGKDVVFVDREHKQEDCIYSMYCWPADVKEELLAIMKERHRLLKAFDDSMKLIYELRNKVARRNLG